MNAQYYQGLGQLFSSIKGLEAALRGYIDCLNGQIEPAFKHPNYPELTVGEKVPSCKLSGHGSFDSLATRYDSQVDEISKIGPELKVIRNALVHGIVFVTETDHPVLLGFKTVDKATEEVVLSEQMTSDRMEHLRGKFVSARDRVHETHRKLLRSS